VRDARDRALLLLGFACGYRASDLVTLHVEHVRFEPEAQAMDVFLARSKEDPLGRGRTTRLFLASNEALCPVRAVRAWLERSALRTGPLFPVLRGRQLETARMHPRAVSRAVQRAVQRAGVSGAYSSHSLRAGLVTSAGAQGHALKDIQHHVGWIDVRTPLRYIDPERGRAVRSLLTGVL
jgi:site-specific recombinase XerD